MTQKTAWFMLQRIREAFIQDTFHAYVGPVEVDETYVGGKKRNWSNQKRKDDYTGPGGDSMTPVIGAEDRDSNQVSAELIEGINKHTMQRFVREKGHCGYHGLHGCSARLQGDAV